MKRLYREGDLLYLENMKYERAAVFSAEALAFPMLDLPEFALWGRCPRRAAKDEWMGGRGTRQGTHTHLRVAARPQREKKI